MDWSIAQSYEDLGKSAFKGANSAHGHLSRFLASVKPGQIAPGSYLIVESLDRLSRADNPDALFSVPGYHSSGNRGGDLDGQ